MRIETEFYWTSFFTCPLVPEGPNSVEHVVLVRSS